jgi:hypothetical protein
MSESENTATKESVTTGLLSTIAERVKASNPAVTERWVDSQVEKEVSDRVGLLDKAMQKRFQCMTELNKVNRPDVVTYDADEKPVSGTYTKERLKAIKDAKEQLAKVENALEKALAGDWSKVKETCK